METGHEECIYNVFKPPVIREEPLEPYDRNSRLLKRARALLRRDKQPRQTMGHPVASLRCPCDFLKKHGGPVKPPLGPPHKCYRGLMPDVPWLGVLSKAGACTGAGDGDGKPKVNFRLRNIQNVMKMKTVYPVIKKVDTPHGDTRAVVGSGVFPQYIYSSKYGKVPRYITRRTSQFAMEKREREDDDARMQPKCKYVMEHERQELLAGLKHNWEKLQNTYNRQSVLTDSMSKVQRKQALENNLKMIEGDIMRLESNPYIYVHGD